MTSDPAKFGNARLISTFTTKNDWVVRFYKDTESAAKDVPVGVFPLIAVAGEPRQVVRSKIAFMKNHALGAMAESVGKPLTAEGMRRIAAGIRNGSLVGVSVCFYSDGPHARVVSAPFTYQDEAERWVPQEDQRGFMYLTREQAVRCEVPAGASVESLLNEQVTALDAYLRGDVYGATITDPQGETYQAWWGVLNWEFCRDEVTDVADEVAREEEELAAEDADSAAPDWGVAEAAAYAKVSKPTIFRACRDKKLEHTRVGGRNKVLTRKDWVDTYMVSLARHHVPVKGGKS